MYDFAPGKYAGEGKGVIGLNGRKIYFLSLVGLPVFLIGRILALYFIIDPVTGFSYEEYRGIQLLFGGALAVFSLVLLFLALIGQTPKPALRRSPVLAVGALLAADVVILKAQERTLHTGAVAVLALMLAFLAVYLGPALSRFSVKVTQVWRLAFVMAVRFWYWTAAILVLAGLAGAAQYYVLPVPTIFILPGAGCMAASFPIEKALRCYMPPKEEGDDAWYYDS